MSELAVRRIQQDKPHARLELKSARAHLDAAQSDAGFELDLAGMKDVPVSMVIAAKCRHFHFVFKDVAAVPPPQPVNAFAQMMAPKPETELPTEKTPTMFNARIYNVLLGRMRDAVPCTQLRNESYVRGVWRSSHR